MVVALIAGIYKAYNSLQLLVMKSLIGISTCKYHKDLIKMCTYWLSNN